jgi:uncharacterized phosphosugar-binding protein
VANAAVAGDYMIVEPQVYVGSLQVYVGSLLLRWTMGAQNALLTITAYTPPIYKSSSVTRIAKLERLLHLLAVMIVISLVPV